VLTAIGPEDRRLYVDRVPLIKNSNEDKILISFRIEAAEAWPEFVC
jgi:hypothetical protein